MKQERNYLDEEWSHEKRFSNGSQFEKKQAGYYNRNGCVLCYKLNKKYRKTQQFSNEVTCFWCSNDRVHKIMLLEQRWKRVVDSIMK